MGLINVSRPQPALRTGLLWQGWAGTHRLQPAGWARVGATTLAVVTFVLQDVLLGGAMTKACATTSSTSRCQRREPQRHRRRAVLGNAPSWASSQQTGLTTASAWLIGVTVTA